MKEKIYKACLTLLLQKIEELRSALNAVTEAGNNETKSSAGDKHETGRAMMQLEQEKLTKQLNEVLEQRSELEKIDISINSSKIRKGSLIKTDKGYLFLSIGLGKINIDKENVFSISAQSPLGSKLMSLKENDVAEMNGVNYKIEMVQ